MITQLLKPLIDGFMEALPMLLTAALIGWLLFYFAVKNAVRLHQRRRNYYGEKRVLQPQTWFKLEPRRHFEIEHTLLKNKDVREFFAPSSRFIRDLREKEKRHQWKLFSPYPEAVKVATAEQGRLPKTQKYLVREQIREASDHIEVKDLPEGTAGADDPENHFQVDLKLDGKPYDAVKGLGASIKSQLQLPHDDWAFVEIKNKDTTTVSFAAHKEEPVDKLATIKVSAAEFIEENPQSKKNAAIPMAVKENGKPWCLPTHHTIVYGMTGSGKSSPINMLIAQEAELVDMGLVKLYGIDPKASELRPYEESRLFEEIAYDDGDAIEVIAQVHKLMKMRSKTKKVDVAARQLGRSLDATFETPTIWLIIDEMLSLLIALQGRKGEGAAAITLLTEILAQGRSLGVYVLGATQEVDKALFGRMRGNFANAVVLRQTSEYFNDWFLGEGAREGGFDSTAIPLSTKANGYAYAGIGFVKEETGRPVRVRFAHSSDEFISQLIERYPKGGRRQQPAKLSTDEVAVAEARSLPLPEYDEDDDGGFTITEEPSARQEDSLEDILTRLRRESS